MGGPATSGGGGYRAMTAMRLSASTQGMGVLDMRVARDNRKRLMLAGRLEIDLPACAQDIDAVRMIAVAILH